MTKIITFALVICCICFSSVNAAIVIDEGEQAVFEYDFSADPVQPTYTFGEITIFFDPLRTGTMEVDVLDDSGGYLFGASSTSSGGESSFGRLFEPISIKNVKGTVVVRNIIGLVSITSVDLYFVGLTEGGLTGGTSNRTLSQVTTPIPAALPLAATAFLALGYVARKRRKIRTVD